MNRTTGAQRYNNRMDRIWDNAMAAKKKWEPYHARVTELEAEGMTTSDAQGVAEAEFLKSIKAVA